MNILKLLYGIINEDLECMNFDNNTRLHVSMTNFLPASLLFNIASDNSVTY